MSELRKDIPMEEVQEQQVPQESIQIDFQTKMQLDFGIINTKLQILNLSKEIVQAKLVDKSVMDFYKELKLEILGHPSND